MVKHGVSDRNCAPVQPLANVRQGAGSSDGGHNSSDQMSEVPKDYCR